MNVEVSDVSELVALARIRNWRRIGVDGIDGVGKSTVAQELGSQLGLPVVGLDAFVEGNQGGYVPHLDFASIAARLRSFDGYVIEGVCLLEILERLETEVDTVVYIKRFSHGYWADEDECVFPEGVEVALDRANRDAELFLEFEAHQRGQTFAPGSAGPLELSAEIMRYHDRYKPHERARVIFRRQGS